MQTKRHSIGPTQALSLKSQELIPGSVHSLDISALVEQPDDLNTISPAVYMTFGKSTPPVLSSVRQQLVLVLSLMTCPCSAWSTEDPVLSTSIAKGLSPAGTRYNFKL